MRKISLTLAIALSGYFSYAQTNTFPSSGNVGIGTTSPGAKLHLVEDASAGSAALNLTNRNNNQTWGMAVDVDAVDDKKLMIFDATASVARFTINTLGNVGIGTTNPGNSVSFQDVNVGSASNGITWYNSDPLHYGIYRTSGTWTGPNYQQMALAWDTGILLNPGTAFNKSYVDIAGGGLRVTSGKVGIGTATPDALLTVKGTIHTQEVKVDMSGWNDFVFDKTYLLPTLLSVKAYIDQNHHLPEIPSEAEVIKNGVNLGEMVKLQTKKIEELTLYLIEKDKQVTEQQKQITEQSKQLTKQQKINQSLQEQINQLAKKINN